MTKEERICKNCEYWYLRVRAIGDCRYNPPTTIMMPWTNAGPDVESRWPEVEATEWCGKFEPSEAFK